MKKILIIKSIFCPNNIQYTQTVKSLIKLNICLNYIKNIHFDLLLIGWSHIYTNKLKLLLKLIKFNFNSIYKEFWSINYGKYKILNYSIDFCNKFDYDEIFYLDHDIYIDIHSIKKFQNVFDLDKSSYGLLSFNQKQDNRHQPNILENKLFVNDLELGYPFNNTGSIATGAFIINAKIFKNISQFELITVYGLDDYNLCNKILNLGYNNMVILNCFVIHPYDFTNTSWIEWKKANILNTIKNNINYYRNIEESMNILLLPV